MTLKIPALRIHGKIIEAEENERVVRTVRIDSVLPARDSQIPDGSDLLWLRFGFVFLGTEKPLIPSFVMDDRGNEFKTLRLMEWVYEKGDIYPRGEVFGYELNYAKEWIETQCFVREIELSLRFFTWVVDDLKAPPAGLSVHRLAVFNDGVSEPTRSKERPADWLLPLQRSRATFWHLPVE